MEVLLLQDIKGIGKKNDLLVVGDGFALNHLLPERRALVATPTVRRRYADQIKKRAVEKETERSAQLKATEVLAGKSLMLKKKAGKTGKLYAAVTAEIIAAAFMEQHGLQVAAEDVLLEEPIKNIGATSVQVKVGNAAQAVPLNIVKED